MPPTLLLADDSVTIQRVIELTFADEDVRVVAVSDGAEAIAFLDQTPPDIVLADAEMPGQNGYEVARHIKASPALAHIPILLLRGAFEPIDEGRAAEVGCDGVLEKPFEPQLVITKVKELLARASAKPRPEAPAADVAAPEGQAPPVALEQWPDTPSNPGATVAASPAAPAGAAGLAVPAPAPRPEFDSYIDRLDAALADLPLNVKRGSRSTSSARPSRAAVEEPPAAAPPEFAPLGEAFGRFLAAEQAAVNPPEPPVWPVGPIASVSASPVVSDELIEEVVRRVLDRMSDRAVRETVGGIAERLVREEIARLKSAAARRGDRRDDM